MSNLTQLSKDWYLATALYDAIDDANLRQAAELLLTKHANPNIIIPDYGITPFHLAVGHENDVFAKEITKLLLKNGGNPNVVGVDGITPLHVAVAWNRSVIVRLLISYGADPWIVDDKEKNSFHYAFEEHAWDALKTLEIYHRTLNLKSNEERSYSIQLDKVVIHANDVQAEYRPHYNGSCCDKKSFNSVGTQTPLPVTVIHSISDLNKPVTEEIKDDDVNYVNDESFDWCEEAHDLMITDDCKRKIMLHRSRSKVYEFSPDKQPCDKKTIDEPNCEIEKKILNSSCCNKNDSNLMINIDNLKNESFKSIKESYSQTCEDVEVRTATIADNVCNNLVERKKITSPECDILFTDESLFSEDQSECTSKKENRREFQKIKTLTLIDESTSVSSFTIDSTSRHNDNESMANTPSKSKKCESKDVKSSKIDLKTGSWSRCFKHCACIPKRMNESDSFTSYRSQRQYQSNRISGIDILPENTALGKADVENHETSSNVGVDVVDGAPITPIDPNISVELKYTDEEDGIEFIEAKLPLCSSLKSTTKLKCESLKRSSSEGAVEDSEISDPGAYDTDYIRKELKKVGFIPGPMAGTPTKRLYLKKLRRIRKSVASPVAHLIRPSFSSELEQVLKDDHWLETLSKWSKLENDVRKHFLECLHPSSWRNGTAKTSFTYLLLDPRISDNLPARCDKMDLIDVWRTFVKAVFYIGKGTRARPYEHLHEAFLIWGETKTYQKRRCSLKVKHILDIWKDGSGVVCVQAFHNLIHAEAYTREAAMIDAIGLPRLKNEKCGMYYGVAASWNSKMKRRLGAFLLYRALRIFIAQNEVQLKPTDVK